MTGLFISLEGGEGSGKSTQAQRLVDFLTRALPEREIVRTREPGGTKQAEAIRDMLVTGSADKFLPETEALLMVAARAEHIAKLIQPALSRDAIVICDRFVDSTYVYQGLAHQIDIASLEALHDFACGGLTPDITFLLDVSVEQGLKRAKARADSSADSESRFEEKGSAFHAKVREGFLSLAKRFSDRFIIVDASGTPDETDKFVSKAMRDYLQKTASAGSVLANAE